MVKLCLLFVILLAANKLVLCLTTDGFVNIDCGNTQSYTDPVTKFIYTPDDQYIDTGTIYNIGNSYKSEIHYQTDLNLRSFPKGDRNCYTLTPVVKDSMYLIRATFFYGNYDGLNSINSNTPILFDLHIGVNFWKMVNISVASFTFEHEAITVALANFLHVCLINTGHGTPFINSLEMRPLETNIYNKYINASQFTNLVARVDFGGNKYTRYPDDIYDRRWRPFIDINGNISTPLKVDNGNSFVVPSVVLQTAIVPAKSTSMDLDFYWTTVNDKPPFYANLHFAEIQILRGIREFNIYLNQKLWDDHEIPNYLEVFSIYSSTALWQPDSGSNEYHFSLNATSNSTYPPLINAVEIFSMLQVKIAMTDLDDIEAILAIKSEYKLNKSWTGDPCAPVNYTWAGVGCSYPGGSPKITSLNLSSSGLNGSISSSFSKLQNIKILDLSNNRLSGIIPDFLSTMSSLQVLILSGNSFSGSCPSALQKKINAGQLTLQDTGDKICQPDHPKRPIIVIIVSVVVVIVAVVVLLLIILLIFYKRKHRVPRPDVQAAVPVPDNVIEIQGVRLKTRKYTKQELETITGNFSKKIGEGGFGSVFVGTLNDKDRTVVAVKKLSETSTQGLKQFLAEAENLAALNHKNLVSLVGYCEDINCLALVYEFMSQGSLEDHIKGKQNYGRTLGWKERLHVVLEAAQGFDYLHRGCRVPIVHRDIKSSNILLGSNLEAKVSDLGLARAFRSTAHKGTIASDICGTRGYIDPEYYTTGVLTEKSDVYGFGVVLMEIITGQSPVTRDQSSREVNLVHYIKEKMKREDITTVIDTRFQRNYDMNSVWKVMELALSCTNDTSAQRPIMAKVVAELTIAQEMENSRVGGGRSESIYSAAGTGVAYNNSGFSNESDMFGPSAR